MRINEFLEFLSNSRRYSDKDRRKTLKRYLASPELYQDIFTPDMNDPDGAANAAQVMEYLSKKKFIKDIASIIQSQDYKPFQGVYGSTTKEKFLAFRSFISLTYAVINVASAALLADGEEYKAVADSKTERRRMYELKEEISSKSTAIEQLQMALERYVKKEVKYLSKSSGLPREFVRVALYSTPGDMVPAQIPNYLSTLLGVLYNMVDEYPKSFDFYGHNVDWHMFFGYLYNRDNIIDIAIYISVEGVNRIDSYSHYEVRDCWDSLTTFALECMEKAPGQSREYMMEKYIGAISTMFANGDRDLRVNLLTIDDIKYPSLANVVSKYANTIKELVDKYQ